MFMATHLIGFGAGAVGNASVVFASSRVDAANAQNYTTGFNAMSFGTAAADRKIIACVGGSAATRTLSSLTIGGVSASYVGRVQSGSMTAEIWIADVPTGTSGNLAVGWSGAQDRCGVGLYAAYGLGAVSVVATDDTTPWTITAAIPAGGIGIVYAFALDDAARTFSWSGAAEDFDETVESPTSHSGAIMTSNSVTMTPSDALITGAMIAATFAPA